MRQHANEQHQNEVGEDDSEDHVSLALFLVQITRPRTSDDEEHAYRPEHAQNDVVEEIDGKTPNEAIVTPKPRDLVQRDPDR